MSQLEDVDPNTWSGRLPPAFPGLLSSSSGNHYLSTARQRTSFDPQMRPDKITSSGGNGNDGDDKSIKSECLPVNNFGEFQYFSVPYSKKNKRLRLSGAIYE